MKVFEGSVSGLTGEVQPLDQVRSSNQDAVTVLDDRTAPDGTRSAAARAGSPGTAILSSADTYTPDPHGPPSRAWQLTLTVVPLRLYAYDGSTRTSSRHSRVCGPNRSPRKNDVDRSSASPAPTALTVTLTVPSVASAATSVKGPVTTSTGVHP
ncbi:hypothetical protein M878_08335 [Streptomyces roseochromogenus subsp. oscitans DS 12.976]|uniref:Uncharacterized protein n=1 Tax=Streptomyces roseochromogenus subsp. oscitans DS 12.976 TaxID=1352936 RepID=V6KTY2_STRRC|nr:hypothetical protein M878_08335 [Streptomyces roseochromogenus subsp. oscitans DS 12.976]